MAVIKCPECGGNSSDKAPRCPHCGSPIAGCITTCPECESVIFSDAEICPACDHPVRGMNDANELYTNACDTFGEG